jgi:hypothetical protein
MSILLSLYFPEGIVFAADKNVTRLYRTPGGIEPDVEVAAATKVIPWAGRRAVVGYCGLGHLGDLTLEEWMRQFAAKTRDFEDLTSLAVQMRQEIQRDFDRDYPEGTDISKEGLIVHLGGFRYESGIAVPAMYLISNTGLDRENAGYHDAERRFGGPSDELPKLAAQGDIKGLSDYKPWLEKIYRGGDLVWFNNGLLYPAFNVFKSHLWSALNMIRKSPIIPLPDTPSFEDRVAYCKMAIELYDSFFRHHFPPRYRSVGGGADVEGVPWPEG